MNAYHIPDVDYEGNEWQIVSLAYTQLWLTRSLPHPWERYHQRGFFLALPKIYIYRYSGLALWGTEHTYRSSGVGDERSNARTIVPEIHGHLKWILEPISKKTPPEVSSGGVLPIRYVEGCGYYFPVFSLIN